MRASRLQIISIGFALIVSSAAFLEKISIPNTRVFRGTPSKNGGSDVILGVFGSHVLELVDESTPEKPGEVISDATSSLRPLRRDVAASALLFSSVLGAYTHAAWAKDNSTITREDVGYICLNETEPTVTDIAYLDI